MPQPGTDKDYKDGFIQITDGIDSNRASTSLGRTQLSWLVNGTMRGEFPQPRPAWRRLRVGANVPFYNQGRFQGAGFYRSDNGRNGLVHMIDGRLYFMRPLSNYNWSVTEVTPSSGPNPSNLKRAWFYQAEQFMIVQDTMSSALIFNGGGSRRAGIGEITSGAAGVYHNGRIWYATPDQRNYRATDLVRGPSGTPAFNYRDAVLKITENTYLNGGGDFSIPDSSDSIVGMAVPAKLDVASGEGNLQVVTRNEVIRVTAPIDRDSWQDVTNPLASIGQSGGGGTGPNNIVIVNGDMMYRDEVGVRSYILANREFNQSWGNTPISDEMTRLFDDDNPYFLQYGSAAVWKNYVLFTVLPRWTQYGYVHDGIGVMNLETLNTMQQKSVPTWEGLWTGGHFLQLVAGEIGGVRRMFAYVLNYNNQVELWELDDRLDGDEDGFGNVHPIPWAFETCSMFKDNLFDFKSLKWGQLAVDEVSGPFSGAVYYRPDADAPWNTWASFETEQDMSNTPNPTPQNVGLGSRRRITLSAPPDGCGDESNARFFYEAQLRFELVGRARVRRFRAVATPRSESTTAEDCEPDTRQRTSAISGVAETYLHPGAYV